jgi:hypothetical protein
MTIAILLGVACGLVMGILIGIEWAKTGVAGSRSRGDQYATYVEKGEAAGCYACDTCSGFRAYGQPCGSCLAAVRGARFNLSGARSPFSPEVL